MKTKNTIIKRENNLEICNFSMLPTKFAAHFHDYWLLGVLLSGKRRLFCNNQCIMLETGQLVALNPFQAHSCSPVDETNACWTSLHISSHIMNQLFAAQDGLAFLFTKPVHKNLAEKFLRIVYEVDASRKLLQLKALLKPLLKKRSREVSDSIINDSIAALKQNHEIFNLDALAKQASMGKTGFLRKFSKHTGITPFRYAESLRLIKAREMLKSGADIGETALAVGYYDQSHFTKAFKANIGVTPAYFKNCFLLKKEF